MGLRGTLSDDIQYIEELQTLDLSYNKGLTGGLHASIGRLSKLANLLVTGCSFYGEIPQEIGSLSRLVYLSLDYNSFTGSIPATIGNLAKLYILDLTNNKLTGTIPISDGVTPGLDMLLRAKHFHLGMNQLSGTIPAKLFSSDMQMIHLRLDRNSLTGPVPLNLNNLKNMGELNLANNNLSGPLPNLTGMNALSFVDMSNNSFDPSDIPSWFSNLPVLTSLYLEHLNIGGQLPQSLFSFSLIETLRLRDNRFNGTLDIGTHYSSQLELVDLRNNQINQIVLGGGYNKQIILIGNPVCNQGGDNLSYCKIVQSTPSYSTPQNCETVPPTCSSDQMLSPNCNCAYPYSGTLYFRAPSFSDLGNTTYYLILEQELKKSFRANNLPVDSVSLDNPYLDSNSNLVISLKVFPSGKIRFSERDITNVGHIFSKIVFRPPKIFVTYYFLGQPYTALDVPAPASKSRHIPVIVGAAAGAVAVVAILIILVVFAIKRTRTKNPVGGCPSFVSWDPSNSTNSIPQLKGARLFSFEEIKKCTNNFSEANEIGNGGYGKVYRGFLSNGGMVAIKRAQQCSLQGGLEFKTEIELLSRVHHKNLVSLVGFCFDQNEQMLIYEYVPNGTLKESLSGKSGICLDWRKRLEVALGVARGLTYLHELANPPIVHRDIKSSNILLDEHLSAKVSDFGISRLIGDDSRSYITTQVKGTTGYLDPEYCMTQQLTEKSDVYSFGVLLFEIIVAKNPVERGYYIVREVKVMLDKSKDFYGLYELLDPELNLRTAPGGFARYIDLAMRCIEEYRVDRPTMKEVANEIETIMQMDGVSLCTDSEHNSLGYEESSSSVIHIGINGASFEYSGEVPSSKLEPK